MLGKIERQEEKGDGRGWDGSMALTARWTWVWASSRSWWWTGKSGVLQSMGLQRVGHSWVTGLTELGRNRATEEIGKPHQCTWTNLWWTCPLVVCIGNWINHYSLFRRERRKNGMENFSPTKSVIGFYQGKNRMLENSPSKIFAFICCLTE